MYKKHGYCLGIARVWKNVAIGCLLGDMAYVVKMAADQLMHSKPVLPRISLTFIAGKGCGGALFDSWN